MWGVVVFSMGGGKLHLDFEGFPNAQGERCVGLPPAHLHMAGTRQRHRVLRLDAAGACGQQHHTVCQVHRFINAMGHIEYGLTLGLPDPQ